jgi:hypothetical protein
MADCTFCGRPAETVEHVIPKWLQNHFDLFDQKLELWNGTTMPQRLATVSAMRTTSRPLDRRCGRAHIYEVSVILSSSAGHPSRASFLLEKYIAEGLTLEAEEKKPT